jgi:hypothetical protein
MEHPDFAVLVKEHMLLRGTIKVIAKHMPHTMSLGGQVYFTCGKEDITHKPWECIKCRLRKALTGGSHAK